MLLIFGLGYTAARIAAAWPDATIGTTRDGRNGTLRFDDEPAVRAALATATRWGRDLLASLTAMFNPLPSIALLPLALHVARLRRVDSGGVEHHGSHLR